MKLLLLTTPELFIKHSPSNLDERIVVVAIQVEADEEVAYDVNLLFKDDATNA